MSIPDACQPVQDEIDATLATVAALQQDLQDARSSQEKRRIVGEINDELGNVERLRDDLQACIDSTRPPPPAPLLASFTGRVSLRIEHPRTPDPFEADVVVPLEFGGDDERYRVVRALSLPALGSRTFPTPMGDCTTTIRQELAAPRPASPPFPGTPAGFLGYFLPQGILPGPLPWGQNFAVSPWPAGTMLLYNPRGWIEHSLSLGEWFDLDSDLYVQPSTHGAGAPMNAAGEVVLVDASPYNRFGTGALVGRRYTIRIAGTVAPRP